MDVLYGIFKYYGPGQNQIINISGVITKFINKSIKNQQITIFGDGEQTEILHVDDVVKLL